MFEQNYYSAGKEMVISTEEVINIVTNYISSISIQLSICTLVIFSLICFKQNFKNNAIRIMKRFTTFDWETKDIVVGLICLFIPFLNLIYFIFIISTVVADIVSNKLNKYIQPIIDVINSKNGDINDYDPRKDI